MEYGQCQNGIEDDLPYIHTNFILDFVHGIAEKCVPMSNSNKQDSHGSV